MKLLFFIPSFNDQEGLPELVLKLVGQYPLSTVLVIDDGSVPSLKLPDLVGLTEASVCLHRMPFNVGIGLATSVAFDYFLDRDFECLVRLDADGQHPLDQIDGLLSRLCEGHADVVWGERLNHMILDSPRQLAGAMTKQATAWMGQLVFDSAVRDWFTGFFALNRAAVLRASSAHLERYCEVQLLCIFHSSKLLIATHEIEQLERQYGKTRIHLLDGIMIFLRSSLMMLLYALRMSPK